MNIAVNIVSNPQEYGLNSNRKMVMRYYSYFTTRLYNQLKNEELLDFFKILAEGGDEEIAGLARESLERIRKGDKIMPVGHINLNPEEVSKEGMHFLERALTRCKKEGVKETITNFLKKLGR